MVIGRPRISSGVCQLHSRHTTACMLAKFYDATLYTSNMAAVTVVERMTSMSRNVGTVTGDFPHSTRDVSVY